MKRSENQRHPAFGIIAMSHVQSGGTDLFLSPVRSHGFVRLTISRASLSESDHAGLSAWPEKSVVEVYLSPVQFAELITQPNRGNGVACTLSRIGAESVPSPPPLDDELTNATKRGGERGVYESARLLDELVVQVQAMVDAGNPVGVKVLAKLAQDLKTARMRSGVDLDYWRRELHQSAGSLRAKVATELHATADLIIRHMGLEALKEKARAMLPTFGAERVIDVDAENSDV